MEDNDIDLPVRNWPPFRPTSIWIHRRANSCFSLVRLRYGKNIQAEILLNTKPQSQNYTSQYSVDSNNSENKTNNLYPIIKQPIYNTQPFQSKENLPPPFIPGQKNYPPNNILRNNQGSRSYPNQNFSNFQQFLTLILITI